MLSHSGLKTAKFVPSSPNWPKMGPGSSQVAPSGPDNPNWLNRSYNCFYLDRFKICWSFKSNNFEFWLESSNMNPILFCKYLSPKKAHKNCFVFKMDLDFHEKKNNLKIWYLVAEILSKLGGAYFFIHPVLLRDLLHFWGNLLGYIHIRCCPHF